MAEIKIKNVDQIADAFDAAQNHKFPVYEGPECPPMAKVILYSNGKLSAEEREKIRSHIRTCLCCSRRSASLKK